MVIGTVRDIAFKARYEGLSNPAIIIIGEVVKLQGSLADRGQRVNKEFVQGVIGFALKK
jgi:siroheme synthase